MKSLGFDVGGTKIEAALFEWLPHEQQQRDDKADFFSLVGGKKTAVRCLARARKPTERQKGYEHIVAQMTALAREVLQTAGLGCDAIQGIGVGLPGAVEPRRQVMLNGNTLVLVGKTLAQDLGNALGFSGELRMGNDANCFALAEHYCGAGLHVAESKGMLPSELTGMGIILGTGCGGGFVVNGKLFEGARGGAAEVGHTILKTGGHACYCGRLGCAEQYLSGTAIEAHFASRKYSQVDGIKTAKEIFDQAALGEPLAVAVIKAYIEDLSDFLAGLANTLNPDYFVLGGGVSLQPAIYQGLEEKVSRKSFLPAEQGKNSSVVLRNVVGDSAGVVGAALLPLSKCAL